MAELNARDLKLVQYLNEAYGKEKELETSLAAHIQMTSDKAYRKRLQDHLRETKGHARQLKSRIKALGGKAEQVSLPGPEVVSDAATGAVNVANRAVAAVKGQGHMIRGTGEQEKLLKNAKTQYWNEFEEIATYNSIETLAETVGDRETAQLARAIRREEERMAKFLDRLIPKLTKAVARDEIPAALRNGGRRRSSGRRASGSRGGAKASSGGAKASSSKRGTAKSKGATAKAATARNSRRAKASSGAKGSGGAKRGAAKSGGGSRTTAKAGATKRSGGRGSTARSSSAKRSSSRGGSRARGAAKR